MAPWLQRLMHLFTTPFVKSLNQGAATTVYCAAHPDCKGVR